MTKVLYFELLKEFKEIAVAVNASYDKVNPCSHFYYITKY